MAFVGFGIFALGLEALMLFRKPDAALLPLYVRLAVGVAIALAGVRRPKNERPAMCLTGLLAVLITSSDWIGTSSAARAVTVATAVVLVWLGTRIRNEQSKHSQNRVLLSLALVIGLFVIVYSL